MNRKIIKNSKIRKLLKNNQVKKLKRIKKSNPRLNKSLFNKLSSTWNNYTTCNNNK